MLRRTFQYPSAHPAARQATRPAAPPAASLPRRPAPCPATWPAACLSDIFINALLSFGQPDGHSTSQRSG